METLALRVRFARLRCKLNQTELDRAIGQTSGYTTRIESGEKQKPDYRMLVRIAEVCGVSIQWLLTGAGSIHEDAERPDPPELLNALRANNYRDSTIALARVRLRFEGYPVTERQWADFLSGLEASESLLKQRQKFDARQFVHKDEEQMPSADKK